MKAKLNLIFFGISALVAGLAIAGNSPLWIIMFNAIASVGNLICFLQSNNIHPENCGDTLTHQQHLGTHPEEGQVSTETDEEKGDLDSHGSGKQ